MPSCHQSAWLGAACQAQADICSVVETETTCQLLACCQVEGVMLQCVTVTFPVLCSPSFTEQDNIAAGSPLKKDTRRAHGSDITPHGTQLVVHLPEGRKGIETEWPLTQNLDAAANDV